MNIIFYVKKNNNKCPVKEFIEKLEAKDRAKILACLKDDPLRKKNHFVFP